MDRPVGHILATLTVTLVVAATVCGLPATAAAADATDEPTVSLVPATDRVGVDDTTTVDLVVRGATDGVGAYNATVSVDGAAEITAVRIGGDAGLQRVDVADDGSSALVVAALMDTAERAATPVTVATLTIRGVGDGTTDAAVSVAELVDEDGHVYSVADATGTSVRVGDTVTERQPTQPSASTAAAPGGVSTDRPAETAADVTASGGADAPDSEPPTRFGLGSERVAVVGAALVALGALFVLGVVVGRRT